MITVVLDGYNVIHAVPELARQLDRSLEAAREALVSLCRDYRARRGDVARLYVVFDGQQDDGPGPHADRSGVTVLFTQRQEEADERILSLIRADGGRSRFVVVSNDVHISNNARALGASILSVQTFCDQARQRPRSFKTSTPDAARERLSVSDAQQITEEYRKRLERRKRPE